MPAHLSVVSLNLGARTLLARCLVLCEPWILNSTCELVGVSNDNAQLWR